jgi:hypothetical protein
MLISHRACKGMIGGVLLLYVIYFPARTFAQERFSETMPGPVTLDLGIKFLERDITEKGDALLPDTSASPTSTRLLAKLSVDITPNFQVYGLIGGSDLQVDDFNGFRSDFGAAYGGGIRITVYPETFRIPVKLFFDGSYLRFQAKDTVFIPGSSIGNPLDETITWNEGVFKFGVAGRQDFFEPYSGIRFSFVRGRDHLEGTTGSDTLDFNEDIVFGLFAGTDIYLDRFRRTALYIEANIIDENSIDAGVKVRF